MFPPRSSSRYIGYQHFSSRHRTLHAGRTLGGYPALGRSECWASPNRRPGQAALRRQGCQAATELLHDPARAPSLDERGKPPPGASATCLSRAYLAHLPALSSRSFMGFSGTIRSTTVATWEKKKPTSTRADHRKRLERLLGKTGIGWKKIGRGRTEEEIGHCFHISNTILHRTTAKLFVRFFFSLETLVTRFPRPAL